MGWDNTVTWTNGNTVTVEKLNQMVSNMQYLYSRMLQWNRIGMANPGVIAPRIASGVVRLGPNTTSDILEADVSFNNFFSIGCSPAVVCTPATTDRVRSDVAIRGLNGLDVDHTGFHVWMAHQIIPSENGPEKWTYAREQAVHWIALGW